MEIVMEHATKYIRKAAVLTDISCHLYGGRVYGLQGVNGCGKTMLLRLMAGLIRPTTGSVVLNGKELGKAMDFPPSLGLLPENPAFLPYCTGLQNLIYLSQLKGNVGTVQLRQVLADVGLSADDKRSFKKYSLGMKQRLGIAAAIMEQPELLLLDEPTNALDTDGVAQICQLIRRERERGALVVVASHDAAVLRQVSDQILTISGGRLETEAAS